MKFMYYLLCFVAFFFITSQSHAQQRDDYSARIDSLITNTKIRPFNGVILISQNAKTKYAKAYGFSNFDKKTPIKLNNNFEIMSNSKQITAVLILLEVEKGKIELDAPIKKYLPELKQSWADTVTVHHLLNHTHGIVDIDKDLLFAPGTDFKYGNLSYSLLGKILEFVSKKSYSENANALFKQLKMKHTSCYAKDKIQNLVTGHYNTNNKFECISTHQITSNSMPADGIVTSAQDLAIWDENLHKGKILKSESYQKMTTSTVMAQHNVFGKDKIAYGYGIRIKDKESPKYYAHTGLGDGFASVNVYFPESDVCLIVLENQMNDNFDLNYLYETEILKILINSKLTNNRKK
jgi:CubicO group peptidase (beta-lactamase class C family)